MAIKANLIIDQGSDYDVTFDLTHANGTVFNLTSYTGRASMRKSPFSSTAKDFTVTIPDAANGALMIAMTSTYSANVTGGRYLYDVEIVSSANVVTRVVQGIATVSPEITR
tara:strand:- start:1 stop:333 length:333 start_codon:yes stop_codon:yes gene_type:complete